MSKSLSLNASVIDATIQSAETTIAHELGRIPLEIFVIRRTGKAKIYRGPTAWDVTNVYIRGSSNNIVRLLIF
jgi:hypothetical protein